LKGERPGFRNAGILPAGFEFRGAAADTKATSTPAAWKAAFLKPRLAIEAREQFSVPPSEEDTPHARITRDFAH
jgi:hypothetical protein